MEEAGSPSLHAIYLAIEQRATAAVAVQPAWPCRRGCDQCCRRLARPPEVTAAEWQGMSAGLRRLPPAARAAIGARILALADHDPAQAGFVVCPFLDEVRGECQIYAFRPAACRLYGFYVGRAGNQWCGDIEAMDRAGELEGVTFGNADAVQGDLVRRFGEPRPLDQWYRATPASERAPLPDPEP